MNAVCFNLRYYAQNQNAAALVAAGAIGRPRLVTGHYLQDWLLLETDWNWRLDAARQGTLRAVADIGSHWIDLTSFVSGQAVTEVFADLHTFITERDRPTGEVETFAASAVDADVARTRATDGERRRRRPACCATTAVPAACARCRRCRPGARTACTGRSTERHRR